MADRTSRARHGDQLVDIDIKALNADGDGIGAYRHQPVIVPGTIAGERVRVQLIAKRADVWLGRVLEVLHPSPHRVQPGCRHFGPCGGCSWQHIAYEEQLRIKRNMLTDIVRAAVPSAPPSKPTLTGVPTSAPWGYRQKVHFVFGEHSANGRARLHIGHYARGSRRIIPVEECPVHDARGNALAFALYGRFQRGGVSTPREPTRRLHRATSAGPGALKSVAIRVAHATDEMLATLVVSDDHDRRLRTATRALLESRTDITGFHLNVHPRDDGFIYGPDTRRIAGARRLREEVAGTPFLISPTAFFQTNVRAAGVLVSLVLDAIPSAASVLDLYAGAGLFAIPLARAGRHVVAVEEHKGAVEDFEVSARLNGLTADRCRVIAQPVENVVRSLTPVDAVVLDPPREGCSLPVADAIFRTLRPPLVVYVSCNPETLARDLKHATAHGYAIRSVQPVDMFPHTAHVESVVVLSHEAHEAKATKNTKKQATKDTKKQATKDTKKQ